MARVKYGPIISDISGSIGSATFQKNLYGNTLRQRPTGSKSSSAKQLMSQSLMSQCHVAWSGLTNESRKQWNEFIAFSGATINRDKSILLTGHSLFLKYNFQRLLAGLSVYTIIRYLSAPQWPGVLNCFLDTTDLMINLNNEGGTSNFGATMFFSIPRPPSQNFNAVGLKYLQPFSVNSEMIDYHEEYQETFGFIPSLGSTLHYKVQFWSTLSPILSSIQRGTFIVEEF